MKYFFLCFFIGFVTARNCADQTEVVVFQYRANHFSEPACEFTGVLGFSYDWSLTQFSWLLATGHTLLPVVYQFMFYDW